MASYDLVIVGYGAEVRAIARKAARVGARVAIVTGLVGFDMRLNGCRRSQVENLVSLLSSVNRGGGEFKDLDFSLDSFLDSILDFLEPWEELEFLQTCGVDVIRGVGKFSDRHTFTISHPVSDPVEDSQINTPKNSLGNTSETTLKNVCKARNFVIVRDGMVSDSAPPNRQILGLNDTQHFTYSFIFDLLKTPNLTSVTLIGSDALGCAIAQLLHHLGIKVQILAQNRLLPELDIDIARIVQTTLELQGIEILTGYLVTAVSDGKIWVNTGAETKTLTRTYAIAQHILIPSLISGFGENFDLNFDLNFLDAGIKVKDGEILLNSKLQTTNPHIYVCSQFQDIDVILKNCLFWAIATTKSYPTTHKTLTVPRAASVGLTEITARLRYGKDLNVIQSHEPNLGFYKILWHNQGHSQEIVGAHFVGDRDFEHLTAIAILMGKKLKPDDLRGVQGIVGELCQEILDVNLVKNWKSFWYKLFEW
jgi:pyruvate/2-oxoglutarate dehydrogenase complex dihydrolipoamide dehydrogenase (E3) component